MTSKVLVAYASRCGSTGEVAQAIAEELTARGKTVDVRLAKSVSSLDGYQAVIVGSAIRMGSWLPEAVEFVTKHQPRLQQIPTAFFTVHMLNRDDSPASRQARKAYTAPVRAILAPNAEAFFAGMIDLARLSLLDRIITSLVKQNTGVSMGDFRDWGKIRGWAQTVTV